MHRSLINSLKFLKFWAFLARTARKFSEKDAPGCLSSEYPTKALAVKNVAWWDAPNTHHATVVLVEPRNHPTIHIHPLTRTWKINRSDRKDHLWGRGHVLLQIYWNEEGSFLHPNWPKRHQVTRKMGRSSLLLASTFGSKTQGMERINLHPENAHRKSNANQIEDAS